MSKSKKSNALVVKTNVKAGLNPQPLPPGKSAPPAA